MKKYQKIRDKRDGSIQTFLEYKGGFFICMGTNGCIVKISEDDIRFFQKLMPIRFTKK